MERAESRGGRDAAKLRENSFQVLKSAGGVPGVPGENNSAPRAQGLQFQTAPDIRRLAKSARGAKD